MNVGDVHGRPERRDGAAAGGGGVLGEEYVLDVQRTTDALDQTGQEVGPDQIRGSTGKFTEQYLNASPFDRGALDVELIDDDGESQENEDPEKVSRDRIHSSLNSNHWNSGDRRHVRTDVECAVQNGAYHDCQEAPTDRSGPNATQPDREECQDGDNQCVIQNVSG